jgi:hemerythrin-like domain-containing protein
MMWEDDILLRGGSYFYDFLNSKGKLTEVGPYILDSKIYLSNIEVIYPLGIFKYMEFKIPESLGLEHDELHRQLVKAIEEGGKVGEAAKAVADVLHPHFEKEEEYALPPLGLLSSLSKQDKIGSEMKSVLTMTDRLKADLPHMIEEHNRIVTALDNLIEVAKKENKTEFVQFAEKLKLHAKIEEQVLYPTAILIGEYLKLRL